MNNIIEKEAAEVELKRIVDFYEVDTEDEGWETTRKSILNAIQKGRIILDEEKNAIILSLIEPVELKTGEVIKELCFKEPRASDLKILDKYKENEKLAKSIHLASRITGVSIEIIERLISRDLTTVGCVASLFF